MKIYEMKVWIIEDERTLSYSLKRRLRRLRPDISVEGISTSVDGAIVAISGRRDLDIIFADIKIDDGLSFSVFDEIETDAMVVFTTAYDEYALKAFDYNCADYLLKPFSDESLEKALVRCEKRLSRISGQQVKQMSGEIVRGQVRYRKRLFVDYGKDTLICPVSSLAYVFTEKGYTRVYLEDGRFGSTTCSLNDLMESLDPVQFCRVNRQTIINIGYAGKISPGPARDFTLHLRHPFQGVEFIMSPDRTKRLKLLLDE